VSGRRWEGNIKVAVRTGEGLDWIQVTNGIDASGDLVRAR
jgi:hypothetical protein